MWVLMHVFGFPAPARCSNFVFENLFGMLVIELLTECFPCLFWLWAGIRSLTDSHLNQQKADLGMGVWQGSIKMQISTFLSQFNPIPHCKIVVWLPRGGGDPPPYTYIDSLNQSQLQNSKFGCEPDEPVDNSKIQNFWRWFGPDFLQGSPKLRTFQFLLNGL